MDAAYQNRFGQEVERYRCQWPLSPLETRVLAAGFSLPCAGANGDWAHVDVVAGRYLFAIVGDVAGHGLASALVAAAVAGSFEGLKVKMNESGAALPLDSILVHLNQVSLALGGRQYPMTLFLACLDLSTGILQTLAAGHPPAIRLSRSSDEAIVIERLHSRAGFLVGWDNAEPPPAAFITQLRPGDKLILASDGVLDLRGANGRRLGPRGLLAAVKNVATVTATPSELLARLTDALQDHLAGSVADDDMTLVVLQWTGVELSTAQAVRTSETRAELITADPT